MKVLLPKDTDSKRPAGNATDPHVVMIIPRGEVVRNFVYTGAVDAVAKNAQVSLFSVMPGEEIDGELRTKYPNYFRLENGHEEPWAVHIQRELLDISHNRWLWSRAAQHRWNLRDVEALTLRQKSKRAVKKVLSMPFASRRGLNLLGKIERTTSRMLSSIDHYRALYERIRPTLVFNGSHVHSAIATQAVQAAQWCGIPTATFIFSWDNLTSQGRIMLPYDHYLVWNEQLKEQLIEMYADISPDRVHVTGTPQFDFHFRDEFAWSREKFCRSVGADPNRPIVLYTTGMANHMPGEPQIVEAIADLLADLDVDVRPQLLVRVYAKDRTGRFNELKDRRPDILFPTVEWEPAWLTPKPGDSYALVNSLRHCALGINIASTVSLELCMFDKPVINIGFDPPELDHKAISFSKYYEFDHYKPVVDSGAVDVAWDRSGLKRLIEEKLKDPTARSKQRKMLVEKMFGSSLDGRSSDRVADVLIRIAAAGKNNNP